MRLLIHNAVALTVGAAVAATMWATSFQAAFLGFIIGTAGTRLAIGLADPETRPSRRAPHRRAPGSTNQR